MGNTIKGYGLNRLPLGAIRNNDDSTSLQVLRLEGNNPTRADGDVLYMSFFLSDDAPALTEVARITATITDVSNTTEDGALGFEVLQAGVLRNLLYLNVTAAGVMSVVINDDQFDVDFRVEADGHANLLFCDAGLLTGRGVVSMGAAPDSTSGLLNLDWPALTYTASTDFSRLRIPSTNIITIPAGTTNVAASVFLVEPNLTATGTVTIAATLYIQDAPTEGGSNYALIVDAGNARFDGTLFSLPTALTIMNLENTATLRIGGTAAHATTPGTNILCLFLGTAPVGTLASGGSLYVASATNVELNYMDSGGNGQQLSTT